jgi:uncharacterized repeat protein (TIGR01451 family)
MKRLILIGILIFWGALGMKIGMETAFADGDQLSLAPLNPEFEEYMRQIKIKGTSSLNYGFVPSPVDMSHTKGIRVFSRKLSYPSSYDLRTLGRLTPVGDQGDCGSCWTFATYGSLESWLLSKPLPETWDFSENNLKNKHDFDLTHTEGGDLFMSTAYLARWSGPIAESDDPYNPKSGVSPSGLKEKKHLETVLMIPDRTGPMDNNDIKQAVMDYGAMYTSMYYSDTYFKSIYNSYYYSGGEASNHAVDIVGWNDNFDRTHFNLPYPSGNGAWIVKNSWGTGWGEGGYFYVSYYDKNIGRYNASFINAQEPASTNYQYDPLGDTRNMGYDTTTAWAANIFTPVTSGECLTEVSFYALDVNTAYEIYIYDTFSSGSFSELLGSKKGSLAYPGYHTVHLDSPIQLILEDNFAIVVKFTTPRCNKPIPVEYPITKYSSRATASSGQSYVSANGTAWTDITTIPDFSNTNVCIKGIANFPEIAILPSSGPIGTTVTARGQNFATSVLVSIDFGTKQTIATTTTNINGTFLVTFMVNTQPKGSTRISVKSKAIIATDYFVITEPPPSPFITLYKSQEKAGNTIIYTITYTNEGSGTATDVNIIEVLPENVKLSIVHSQQSIVSYWVIDHWQTDFSELATKIRWLIPQVAPASSGTVSFTVEVE